MPEPKSSGEPDLGVFQGGPWHGRTRPLEAAISGGPPDLVRAPFHADGVYALAGGADAEGFLPYRWMSWARVAELQATGATALVESTQAADRLTRVKRVG